MSLSGYVEAVVGGGRMKFNKTEVALLASQPSHRFEKEGVLFVREKQEGFFKRNEISVERWCRLRGNLLFYFKSRDQWSEAAGVIVLENVVVEVDNSGLDGTFGLLLTFGSSLLQHLSTFTEAERDSWQSALQAASHTCMKARLASLQERLGTLTVGQQQPGELVEEPSTQGVDPDSPPLLESSLACDNLLCDALGRPPSTRLLVYVRNSSHGEWRAYGSTEVVERTSNPSFMVTVSFRGEHRIGPSTQVRICAQDLRERLTMTRTTLGNAFVSLEELQKSDRVRLRLDSPNPEGRGAGFVTVTSWSVERENSQSTNSTPSHTSHTSHPTHLSMTSQTSHTTQTCHSTGGQLSLPSNNFHTSTSCHMSLPPPVKHQRSRSLPPSMQHRYRIPRHPHLLLLHSQPCVRSYRLHSGLGGDISLMEVMAEPRLAFVFPQQLLTLWIAEEKELVHEIAGLGELREPWHTGQMRWLENHLNLINTYSIALENLDNYRGPNFKRSSLKDDPTYEFVPTNLHLQRVWAQNESLRKASFYDIHTVGAFNAFSQKTKSQGLIKMLKELKSPQKDSSAWCSLSDKLQMAEDSLAAVRKVRREVVDCMRLLMKLAKENVAEGMFLIVEDMLKKTKLLCNISDTVLVEEALTFLEKNKVTVRPEKDEFSESVAEFMQRNRLKIDLQFPRSNTGSKTMTPCTEFISSELATPDCDPCSGEYWRGYSVFTSGYQSVDRLSDIDEFEESFKVMSVEDKTRHYYTLFRDVSPLESPLYSPVSTPSHSHIQDTTHHTSHTHGEQVSHHPQIEEGEEDDSAAEDSALEDEHSEVSIVRDEVEEFDDDESTPHVGSETSKTQSPSSLGKISAQIEEKIIIEIEEEKLEEEDFEENCCSKTEDSDEVKGSEGDSTREANTVDTPERRKDQGIVSDNETSPHYRNGDEPEPIDLTHLNIEASMMCLASKVRSICGKANSPTLSARTFRFKELDSIKRTQKGWERSVPTVTGVCTESGSDTEANFKIPDVPKPCCGSEEVTDWAGEVRPSMRKLRQGMDSLLKTSRLMCSVLRLQQLKDAVELTHLVKHRRDVCFSQALTSLVTSLMTRLWCHSPDHTFLSILTSLGPLVCFEGLLSLHGEDVTILNDMIVAIEDLRSVEFTLILVETKKSRQKTKSEKAVSVSSFPLPRVTGSRTSLKVMLPVPDWVYTLLPLQEIKTMTFNITPVFFNIGINEQATLADKLGLNGAQEKNNSDNYKILLDYFRRFRKGGFFGLSGDRKPRGGGRTGVGQSDEALVEDLMSILKNEVANRKSKNVDVLNLASQICLKLNGLRFTSCKSGKDRTGMSVTLEQINILSREFDLADSEYQRALDTVRSEGTRRYNCAKNIDVDKYAFNSLQLATFPRQYRPPVGTYGSARN